MKNGFVSMILAIILVALVFCPGGCGIYTKPYYEQLGETEAEGKIRHKRNLRISQGQLMEDIDRALLIDKPSSLGNKRIP